MSAKVSFRITKKQKFIDRGLTDGQISFVQDTGEIYVDYNQQRKLFAEVNPQWDVSDLDNEGQEDDEQPKSFLEYDENRNIVGLVHDRELNDFDEDNGVWLPKNPIISENYALGINENAFNGCNRLTKIICQNVTTIGASAFANCSQLQSIKFPSVSTVSNDAFNLCVKLENVELPNVTFLNYGAFSHCYRLEKIYLPSLVTLKRDVFNACVTLSQVDFPNAETTDIGTFAGCYGLQEIELPSLVTVGELTFNACQSLKVIVLPNVTSIGRSAFSDSTAGMIGCKWSMSLNPNKIVLSSMTKQTVLNNREYWWLKNSCQQVICSDETFSMEDL